MRKIKDGNVIYLAKKDENSMNLRCINCGEVKNEANITDPRIKNIALHYSYDRQSIKFIEEMAELQQAICKHRESKDKDKTLIDIKSEIADVYVLLDQMKYLLNIKDKELEEIKDYKINRQLLRIKTKE